MTDAMATTSKQRREKGALECRYRQESDVTEPNQLATVLRERGGGTWCKISSSRVKPERNAQRQQSDSAS